MRTTKQLRWPPDQTLKKINFVLLLAIVLVAGYVVLMPFLPRVQYEVAQHITKPVKVVPGQPKTVAAIDHTRDHLIMPSLQFDQPVLQGSSPYTVDKGLWMRPKASRPDKNSNTVIVGHRFNYTDAPTLYNLDKLRIGDDIYLVYSGKIYHYRVAMQKIVEPTAVEIENPTDEAQLTIYTCTPLWTNKQRLVYISNLVEILP